MDTNVKLSIRELMDIESALRLHGDACKVAAQNAADLVAAGTLPADVATTLKARSDRVGALLAKIEASIG